jgi:peptidoglycan-associated lipoprotein
MNLAKGWACVGAIGLLSACSTGVFQRKDAAPASGPRAVAPVTTAMVIPVATTPGAQPAPPPQPAAQPAAAAPPPPPAETVAVAPPAPAPPPILDLPNVIYFDTDAYTVRPEYRLLLELHARNLKADPKRRLIVQAHADPRGPTDYNLALAAKRADTVIRLLESFGADKSQIEPQAEGEAPSAGSGADLSKSRRVELIYRQ